MIIHLGIISHESMCDVLYISCSKTDNYHKKKEKKNHIINLSDVFAGLFAIGEGLFTSYKKKKRLYRNRSVLNFINFYCQ